MDAIGKEVQKPKVAAKFQTQAKRGARTLSHRDESDRLLKRRLKHEGRCYANLMELQLDVGTGMFAVSHIDKHALSKAMQVIQISKPQCRYTVPFRERCRCLEA